jgi:hypothetical protein
MTNEKLLPCPICGCRGVEQVLGSLDYISCTTRNCIDGHSTSNGAIRARELWNNLPRAPQLTKEEQKPCESNEHIWGSGGKCNHNHCNICGTCAGGGYCKLPRAPELTELQKRVVKASEDATAVEGCSDNWKPCPVDGDITEIKTIQFRRPVKPAWKVCMNPNGVTLTRGDNQIYLSNEEWENMLVATEKPTQSFAGHCPDCRNMFADCKCPNPNVKCGL